MRPTQATLALLAAAALATPAVASSASAQAPSREDIVRTAVDAGSFTTVTKLLTRSGLAATLRGSGPYTVFAPTDAAFRKVPKATLDGLLRDRAKLRAVLLYHVVPGRVTADRVVRLRSARTLNGGTVRIGVTGSRVLVNDARVTSPDVMATNGVIHVIDRVLIPPAR